MILFVYQELYVIDLSATLTELLPSGLKIDTSFMPLVSVSVLFWRYRTCIGKAINARY